MNPIDASTDTESVDDSPSSGPPIVDPDTAIGWLRDIRRMWRYLDDAGRRDLINAVYDRVTVTSEGIVEVELTPDAQRHGAALALPERVVLARPEGNGQRPTTHKIPIKGRREWLKLARTA